MRVKLYRAAGMSAAMALIRSELGPEAMILATRRVAEGIEVTAALEDAEPSLTDVEFESDAGDARDAAPFQSGAFQSGAFQSGALQSGAPQSGAVWSGAFQSGVSQSGAFQSGAFQPGAFRSGASQSSTFQSGPSPSGASRSGTVQSGASQFGVPQYPEVLDDADGVAPHDGARQAGSRDRRVYRDDWESPPARTPGLHDGFEQQRPAALSARNATGARAAAAGFDAPAPAGTPPAARARGGAFGETSGGGNGEHDAGARHAFERSPDRSTVLQQMIAASGRAAHGRSAEQANLRDAGESASSRAEMGPQTGLRAHALRAPGAARVVARGEGDAGHRSAALAWHGVPPDVSARLSAGPLAFALSIALPFASLDLEPGAAPLFLAGPPGAGKTLTAARLATRLVLAGCQPLVITADGRRAGATEQLAAFTRLLGLHLLVASTPAALQRALARRRNDEPVLIDGPGIDPFVPAQLEELASLAASVRAVTALVCPAGLDPNEAADLASIHRARGATLMIANRLDTGRRLGGVLAAANAGLALTQAGIGPGAADGLIALTPDILATRLNTVPDRSS